jgi:hypothetical protein
MLGTGVGMFIAAVFFVWKLYLEDSNPNLR